MASRTRVLQNCFIAALTAGAAALTLAPAGASAFSLSNVDGLARAHPAVSAGRSDRSSDRTTDGPRANQLDDGGARLLPKGLADSGRADSKASVRSDRFKLGDWAPHRIRYIGEKTLEDDRRPQARELLGLGVENNVFAADARFVQIHKDRPIIHHGRHRFLRTLHITAADGSNTLVNVQITTTGGVTASYDNASQTVSGVGGPGTITVTGEVETLDGNVPFELTIPVS